jgi:hypothetical protein
MAMQDLSGEEVMRLIEARERRRAAQPLPQEPMGMASPEMVAALERIQTPEQLPAPVVEEPRRMPLVAPPAPELPMGAMTPEEGQALAEFQATQGRAANIESVLPFLRAGQQITQAWTGAPVDVQGLEGIQQAARRPSEEAAQRLALAREFAKRRMEGQAQEQRMGLSERELGLRETALGQEGILTQQQMALRAMAEQRMAEAEARRARVGPKPVDEMAQRKKELEIKKLEKEIAAMEGGRMTPEQETKALQLEKLKREMRGEDPKKVKSAEASASNIVELLNELRALYKQHGPQKFGPEARRMQQLSRMIAIEAKGEGMAALGALSGPDQTILEQIQGAQPTELFANTFGLADPLEAMDTMEMWVKTRLNTARKVYGPSGEETKPKSQFPITVKDMQSGQTYIINNRAEADKLRPIADRLEVMP